MCEHRPVIALDFPILRRSRILSLFPAEESLYLKSGNGALLCGRSRSCPLFEVTRA